MNRLIQNHVRYGLLVLALFATVLLMSCSSDDPVAPVITNGAPTAPTIDVASGAPADGATDVALAAAMHWTCSDPDDDPLTYTVKFGTAAEPPNVAEDLATVAYTPAALAHATTYNWQIVAKDDGGKSTAGAVWSFTTAAAPLETVGAPTTPVGVDAVTTDQFPQYTTGGAVSSEGHGLEYRFDWDDGNMSDWAATTAVAYRWATPGTYDVAAQARCATDTGAESAWSVALTVTVTAGAAETVTTPDPPDGPTSLLVGVSGNYLVSGATSSMGHDVQYRVDWGNTTISDWTAASEFSLFWNTAGTYSVRVQARCQLHHDIESAWSAATDVTVSVAPAETIGNPDPPTGPATGLTTSSVAFSTSTVTTSAGHLVAYVFDFGDGTDSSLIYTPSTSHWYEAGTYDVRVMALCSDHPEIASPWSDATQVTITEPLETVRPFYMSSGIVDFAAVGEEVWVNSSATSTNLGHDVEYHYDLGDGTITDWATSTTVYHTWTTAGTYILRGQARCIEHPDVITEWSDGSHAQEIQIFGDVESMLPAEVGPSIPVTRTGLVEYSYSISCGSSMGHRFEVRMNWGNGEESDWIPQYLTQNPVYLDYTYMDSGIFEISGQARCIEHPEIISEWSPTTTITVPEFVTRPTFSGETTGTVGVPVSFLAADAVSSEGHALEYALQLGSSFTAYTSSPAMEHTFMNPGTYSVRTRARCAEHPEIGSPVSLETLSVVITE